MVTAGLLLSLEAKESSDRLASMLSARDAVFPGSPEGTWLPVAVEAADDGGLRELHDWIAGLPGVAYVDVVHVSFDDALMFPPTLPT